MKYVLRLFVVAAILGLAGCGQSHDGQSTSIITNAEPLVDNTDVPSKSGMSLDLPEAHVDVLPYQPMHVRPMDSYEVSLRMTYADGSPVRRTLELAKSNDSLGSGLTASLHDVDGSILCSVTQRWGASEDSAVHYFMSEKTSLDSLTLHASVDGSDVVERYDYNGATIALEYTRGTASEDSAGRAFEDFYENAMNASHGTLEGNPDASVMADMLSDPDFINWVSVSVLPPVQDNGIAKVACDAECVCGIASLCAALKCTFGGGWLNFMCDACFGTSIACAIAAVVTRWDAR